MTIGTLQAPMSSCCPELPRLPRIGWRFNWLRLRRRDCDGQCSCLEAGRDINRIIDDLEDQRARLRMGMPPF